MQASEKFFFVVGLDTEVLFSAAPSRAGAATKVLRMPARATGMRVRCHHQRAHILRGFLSRGSKGGVWDATLHVHRPPWSLHAPVRYEQFIQYDILSYSKVIWFFERSKVQVWTMGYQVKILSGNFHIILSYRT